MRPRLFSGKRTEAFLNTDKQGCYTDPCSTGGAKQRRFSLANRQHSTIDQVFLWAEAHPTVCLSASDVGWASAHRSEDGALEHRWTKAHPTSVVLFYPSSKAGAIRFVDTLQRYAANLTRIKTFGPQALVEGIAADA